MKTIGLEIKELAMKLFPICRSITGSGVRETLDILGEICSIKKYEVPTGTQVFDWEIPKEWNIKDAWIKDEAGNKIVDFNENNLHIVGYSTPVNGVVEADELLEHLYSLPDQPNVIPYVTSYYKERWGFCVTNKMKEEIKKRRGSYHVYIDSKLENGSLTYGEIILPGESNEEILLSTYICHPSMANNELSGPCVLIYLAKWLSALVRRKYTYRIVFVPETIGSITYLSKNLDHMKKYVVAGFNLTCIGNEDAFSYIPSRYGNTLADKVALNVLRNSRKQFHEYTFLDRGSDERQYCAPGVDLPVCSVTKTKYGEYPEYHTSADNMDFITSKALQESFEFYQRCIQILENNQRYKINCFCEPQLGKRGLYPTESFKGSANSVKVMMDFIAYADGKNDIIDISNLIHADAITLVDIADKLKKNNLLEEVENESE